MAQKTVNDYVELIETVARVEANRLSSHMVDYSELVNIGALAVQHAAENLTLIQSLTFHICQPPLSGAI